MVLLASSVRMPPEANVTGPQVVVLVATVGRFHNCRFSTDEAATGVIVADIMRLEGMLNPY